jgi:hypothetical protein
MTLLDADIKPNRKHNLRSWILARNYAAIATKNGSQEGAEVLCALRQLTATEMVMAVEEVSPDTRVPQDLNIY